MRFWWQRKPPKATPIHFTDYPVTCNGCSNKRTTACTFPKVEPNCKFYKVTKLDTPPDRFWRIKCPDCGSKDTAGTYGTRYECRKCGRIFG